MKWINIVVQLTDEIKQTLIKDNALKTDMKDVATWIPRDIFEAYCGLRTERLLRFYDKAVEKKNQLSWDFNLLGFLFLPAWLGYRKQWKFLAGLTVAMVLIIFGEAFFGITLPTGGFLGMFIVFGFLCNGLMLSSIQAEFIKLKEQGLDNIQIRKVLQDKASPSVLVAVVVGIAYLAILVGAVILADIWFGLPL